MIALGMLVLYGGYAVGSWGYVLVKGYNITLWEWIDPLTVYKWPSSPPKVPKGHIFPTKSG